MYGRLLHVKRPGKNSYVFYNPPGKAAGLGKTAKRAKAEYHSLVFVRTQNGVVTFLIEDAYAWNKVFYAISIDSIAANIRLGHF